MSFASPWWIGAGALLAAALLFLHVLRPLPKKAQVSSLFLWRLATEELAATERRRRFLANLVLFLQLACLLGLALALSRPSLRQEITPIHLAIVVDTSASMAVAGTRGTRIDEAVARLEEILAAGDAERYTLLTSQGGPPLYDGRSKEELLRALRSLPSPAGTSDWPAAAEALQAAASGLLPATVLLVTDGALPASDLQPLAASFPGATLFALITGDSEGNVGITSFTARPVGGDPWRHQVLLRAANYSSLSASVQLSVKALRPGGAAAPVLEQTLEIPPHQRAEILFEHTFGPGEGLSAVIDTADAFSLDNEAHLVANVPQAVRILLVGTSDHFLREGFSILPQVRVDFSPGLPLEVGAYHLVVFVDHPVPPDFSGTAAQFATLPATAGAPVQITSWNRAHPLSRFVDWESVALAGIAAVSPGPGERRLVDSSAGPLVTEYEGETLRIVRVGIPLHGSDFPFRVAFPVFLYNLIQWAAPDGVHSVTDPLQPGRLPEALRRLAAGERVLLAREGEEPRELSLLDPDELRAILARPGVYSWTSGGEAGRFAVSLVDPEESNLARRLDAELASLGIISLESAHGSDLWSARAHEQAKVEHPLWRWFAAAALVALAAEGIAATWRPTRRLRKVADAPRGTTPLLGTGPSAPTGARLKGGGR